MLATCYMLFTLVTMNFACFLDAVDSIEARMLE